MVYLTIYRCLSINIKKALITDLLIGVIRSEKKIKCIV